MKKKKTILKGYVFNKMDTNILLNLSIFHQELFRVLGFKSLKFQINKRNIKSSRMQKYILLRIQYSNWRTFDNSKRTQILQLLFEYKLVHFLHTACIQNNHSVNFLLDNKKEGGKKNEFYIMVQNCF